MDGGQAVVVKKATEWEHYDKSLWASDTIWLCYLWLLFNIHFFYHRHHAYGRGHATQRIRILCGIVLYPIPDDDDKWQKCRSREII